MQKQKNACNDPMYKKWPLPLANIYYNGKAANIVSFSMFAYNKRSIMEMLDVLSAIAKQCEFSDNVVENKTILLKNNFATV